MKSKFTPDRRGSRFRSICGRCLIIVAIPLFYAYAVREVPLQAILSALAGLQGTGLLLLLFCNLLVTACMCLRWSLILQRIGYPIPLGRLMLYRTGANAISFVTPGPQFGGEPMQIYLLKRFHGVDPATGGASVAVDRLIELLTNFLVLIAAGLYLSHALYPNAVSGLMLAALMVVTALVCRYLGALTAGRPALSRFLRQRCRPLLTSISATAVFALENCEQKAAWILRPPGRVIPSYGALALLHWLAILAEFWLIYALMGIRLDPIQLVALVAAARFALLLPIPGALGVLEAGQVSVLLGLAMDPALALAACLVMRARDLLMVSIGAGLSTFWIASGRHASPRHISALALHASRDND